MPDISFGNAAIAVGLIFVFLLFFWGATSKSTMVVPSDQQTVPMPEYMSPVFQIVGFPAAWLYFPAFIYYAIIPMAGVMLILYGFLDMLRIFGPGRSSVNMALAILIGLSTVPMGSFVSTISVLFGILGIYVTAVFGVLMFVGVFFIGSGLLGGWRAGALEARLFEDEERDLINAERKLQKEISDDEKMVKEIFNDVRAGRLTSDAGEAEIQQLRISDLRKRQSINALKRRKAIVEKRKAEAAQKSKSLSTGKEPSSSYIS
jgi:hypothetical protein